MREVTSAALVAILVATLAISVAVALWVSLERQDAECRDLVAVMVEEQTTTADMARALRDARCPVRTYLTERTAEDE